MLYPILVKVEAIFMGVRRKRIMGEWGVIPIEAESPESAQAIAEHDLLDHFRMMAVARNQHAAEQIRSVGFCHATATELPNGHKRVTCYEKT